MFDENRDDLDLFEMANQFPRTTGLPMTVWVGPRGNAQHDARVKVCMTPGDQMDIHNTAVVGIRPTPRLIEGTLSTPDKMAVFKWIERNKAALIDHWDGKIDGSELSALLIKV
jgi:hypothetical protein